MGDIEIEIETVIVMDAKSDFVFTCKAGSLTDRHVEGPPSL